MFDISIIIAAYNEAKRLAPFLERVAGYAAKSGRRCEIIVVDDGSRDETSSIAHSYASRYPDLNVITLERNFGKGRAVKTGMLAAQGEIRIFMDADGSVDPAEIDKNLHYITEDGYDIFAGSRVLKSAGSRVDARFMRMAMGGIFRFLVRHLLFREILDTQCGFKMFRSKAAQSLFSQSTIDGFGFDLEILYAALKGGYRVKEGPVSWKHVDGSKINLIADPPKMFMNILEIRNRKGWR